jgi:copper chaperone CopZ
LTWSNDGSIKKPDKREETSMKIKFYVPDMTCPNCAMHLEGLEDELPGIKSISASYKKLSMEVEFDESKVSIGEIIDAAKEIGYHPEPAAQS